MDFVQIIAAGILLGGIYGLAAFGLSLIFGVLRIMNLAHGTLLFLGALVAFTIKTHFDLPVPVYIFLTALCLFAVGWIFCSFICSFTEIHSKSGLMASIIVTLGTALIVQDLATTTMANPLISLRLFLPSFEVSGINISGTRLIVLIMLLVPAGISTLLLRKSWMGLAIRSVVQMPDAAWLYGVSKSRVFAITFGFGAAMAGIAGALYLIMFTVNPGSGIPLTMKCLCVVILGGIGSMAGSVSGGILLGIAETLTSALIGPQWSPAIALLLFIAVLLCKPQGLLPEQN
jgi:branched-chain amino acid transport system permease protein